MSNASRYTMMMTDEWYVRDHRLDSYVITGRDSGIDIAFYLSKDIAEHIAACHNAWLHALEEICELPSTQDSSSPEQSSSASL